MNKARYHIIKDTVRLNFKCRQCGEVHNRTFNHSQIHDGSMPIEKLQQLVTDTVRADAKAWKEKRPCEKREKSHGT